MRHDDYYIDDVPDEGVMYVEDECEDCEYEIAEDVDVWYRLGSAHYIWDCPKCGHENEWVRELD